MLELRSKSEMWDFPPPRFARRKMWNFPPQKLQINGGAHYVGVEIEVRAPGKSAHYAGAHYRGKPIIGGGCF